jgi:Bacteriophage replication protein O
MTAPRATTATDPPPEAPTPAFRGFRSPTYTMVQDELFDELLPDLSGAELKVLLFVVRRTFGFKRDDDAISLAQMLRGITTREGRVLHRGVGLSKPTLLEALRSLRAKGVLRAERRRSAAKGNEPTVYALRFAARDDPGAVTRQADRRAEPEASLHRAPPLDKKVDQGVGQAALPSPWSSGLTTQHTGSQQRGEQHHPQTPPPALTTQGDPLAPSAPDRQEPTGAVDDAALLAHLISHGITHRIARDLVTTHSAEAIRQQVAWQPYRPAAKSPAGALVQAIRDAWPPPPAWFEAQEHTAAVARQAEEEARRREEEEARRRAWEQKPPEERIAGRLQFWLLGQRRKGREPTEAEVAAKRAAFLIQLAAPAEASGGEQEGRP